MIFSIHHRVSSLLFLMTNYILSSLKTILIFYLYYEKCIEIYFLKDITMKRLCLMLIVSLLLVPTTFAAHIYQKEVQGEKRSLTVPDDLFNQKEPNGTGLNLEKIKETLTKEQTGDSFAFATDVLNYIMARDARIVKGKEISKMLPAQREFEKNQMTEEAVNKVKEIFAQYPGQPPFPSKNDLNEKDYKKAIETALNTRVDGVRKEMQRTKAEMDTLHKALRSVLTLENISLLPKAAAIAPVPAAK